MKRYKKAINQLCIKVIGRKLQHLEHTKETKGESLEEERGIFTLMLVFSCLSLVFNQKLAWYTIAHIADRFKVRFW
ncbi:hypothetical protein ACET3Z_031379 [Daucus carota]